MDQMTPIIDPLVRDFVAWIAREPRPYTEALEAWRTSCPRLTVWEEAHDRGLIAREWGEAGAELRVTEQGRAYLKRLP